MSSPAQPIILAAQDELQDPTGVRWPATELVQHMQDIAHGAVASIKRIPGQPFSDLAGSPVHQAMFEARVSTVAAKHSRGVMAAKMRSFPKFL